jgi:hypothetical protein
MEIFTMTIAGWFSKRLDRSTVFTGCLRKPANRRCNPARRQLGARLGLEALEDRWMPSTLTVTNNLDSGADSLRAKIAAAHNGDTINFAPALDGQTITLSNGELIIRKSLTINGFADRNVTISGGGSSRVFELFKGVTDTLSGLTISNGFFTGTGGAGGGGILVDTNANVMVSNCTLTGNQAGQGAGILNEGTLTVSGSTLSGNSCSSGGSGGGIHNDGTLTVSGSTLSGNSAGWGGGIYNDGPLTMSDSTLTGNSARYAGGALSNGGPATVTGCTFSGNSAASGGAIDNGLVATLTLSGSTLAGNSAGSGGGIRVHNGTVTLTNDTVTDNTARVAGGGLFIDSGATVYLDAFTVANILNNTDSSGLNGPTANIYGAYTLR